MMLAKTWHLTYIFTLRSNQIPLVSLNSTVLSHPSRRNRRTLSRRRSLLVHQQTCMVIKEVVFNRSSRYHIRVTILRGSCWYALAHHAHDVRVLCHQRCSSTHDVWMLNLAGVQSRCLVEIERLPLHCRQDLVSEVACSIATCTDAAIRRTHARTATRLMVVHRVRQAVRGR